MHRNGYASVWGKAALGHKGSPVGGVAIFVSTILGCKECPVDMQSERAVAARVQVQGEREIIVVSAYLHSGRGFKLPRLELLGAIASLQDKHQRYVIAAGDWQNRPPAINSTGVLHKGRLTTISPKRATCVMKKSSSIIDFFIASAALAPRFSEPHAHVVGQIATHRPVWVDFDVNNHHYQRKLVMPSKLPAAPKINNWALQQTSRVGRSTTRSPKSSGVSMDGLHGQV